MSASNVDKHSKAKNKKPSILTIKSTKHTKGKEASINDEKFRGDGVSFKCKLLGVTEVSGSRGDNMCIEAIKKLKQHIKQTGDHKQKIMINITLKGIRIFDEKSKNVIYEHPVNKVSFITHDPDDKKIFSYICSTHSKTGHMMYAIKYDKVAGMITATIFELFQAVFKLRQEAANQKRTQTNNLSNARASPADANGASAASPLDETNIYEEPKSTPSPLETQADNTSDGHYKVPPARPLPPAPYAPPATYAPPTTNDSHQPAHHEIKSQPQSLDSQATSFASDSLFSSSVFAQADSTSDTVSMSSVDIIRKESISSSSSETTSFDTKSLDLKAGHSAGTPPTSHPRHAVLASPAVTCPEGPVGLTSPETGAIPDEDHDYETIPSSNYETIPSRTEKKEFQGFNFKESFTDLEPFPRNDSLNDPSATNGSSVIDNPTSGAFGNDDLFECFGDSNFNATSSSDFPVDDPFAPTTAASAPQEPQSQGTDAFTSSDSFETAFGSTNMSPLAFPPSKASDNTDIKGEESSGEVPEEPSMQNQETGPVAFTNQFETAFGTAEISPPSFNPTVNIQKEDEKDSDTAWGSAAVEQNGNVAADLEDNKSRRSEESSEKESVKWEDSFGMNFNSATEKEPQSGSPDVKHEESWSTAFDAKQPPPEVSFSWDDAFGTPADSNDGEDKDAFASTPFKGSGSKTLPAFLDPADAFSSFGSVALDSAVREPEKTENDSRDDVPGEITPVENKQGGLEESRPKEFEETEDEYKQQLADNEDSSSSDKENGGENEKLTIPIVLEPISERHSDDVSSENSTSLTSIQPMKPKDDVISPNVPPPLPPRAKAALPVLPPRPRTYSSPNQVPPTPPRPTGSSGSSGRDSPASKGKRPPALPPRIDLEVGKPRSISNPPVPVPVSVAGFNPDAFSSPINEGTSVSWQANWGNEASKEDNVKENVTISKTSADPFNDDFFTDFKDTSTKPNDATHDNQNFFADPFLAKEGSDDMFKAGFGGEDPFAGFTSNNKGKKNDPFLSDGEGAFPGFSLNNDPFGDVSDPFAENIAVNDDPFGGDPKKKEAENISFQLSKDSSSEGDFADSFA